MFESGRTEDPPDVPAGTPSLMDGERCAMSLGALRRRLRDELDGDSLVELSRRVVEDAAIAERTEVELIQAVAAWDAQQAWAVDHALTPVPWLTVRTTRSRADAGRLVRSARLCRAVPAIAQALEAGLLSTTQLGLLAGAAGQGRGALLAEHVDTLLGFAKDLNIHDFTRVVKRWRELADDELGRTDPAARDAQEHVRLDATMDDTWRLSGLIGAELAAMLKACLDRYDQPDPADTAIPRTRPQRDVDNLRSILKDLMGGKTGQPNITITCVIDLDLLEPARVDGDDPVAALRSSLPRLDRRCRINGLGDVERHELERMMCESSLNRVILRGGSCVLDYGRRARYFSNAQREAIMIRDGFHCAVEGCRRTDLDVHHLHEYERGGPTDLANGACLCHRHHTLLHRDKLTARWNDRGELVLSTPLRI